MARMTIPPLYPDGYLVKGRYRLVRSLGAGAMGSVSEAVDTKLGKGVAVKFLDPMLARDPRNAARFQREARAAAQLRHDNVCDVTEIDETDDGVPFLVMEMLHGETLSRRWSWSSPPSPTSGRSRDQGPGLDSDGGVVTRNEGLFPFPIREEWGWS